MSVLTVTRDNIKTEVIDSDKTVLIDFWAPWCGPCRMFSPIVDQVANEVPNVKVAKVNVDEEQYLAMKFGVMSIPTLVVMKGGKIINKSVGARSKAAVLEMLKS
ncbi:MAG: thioredoxin [Clostridiales bacterium]|nr:thioredoxin [Clostridiales bacterium]